MKNKGFTLVELLAVIILLAVIALIATPIILNVINDSRESATMDSVSGIYHAIEIDYAERLEFSGNATYTYSNGGLVTTDANGNNVNLPLSGALSRGAEAKGTVAGGNIKVAAWVGDKCYTKLDSKGSPQINASGTDKATCLALAN